MIAPPGKLRKPKAECACPRWVTGRLAFQLETDPADEDRAVELNVIAPWPARTSISEGYVRKMEARLPGAMEIQDVRGGGLRLVIRVSNTKEIAYRIWRVCPCGNLLIERDDLRVSVSA